jgi:hypothetical protein
LVVSLAFALVTPFALLIAFGESVDYLTPMDPAAFYALSYEKQQEWLRVNSRRNSGFTELVNRSSDARFWTQEYVPAALGAFVLVFLSCVTFAVWNGNMRSNSTPHADARAGASLDQPPSARAGERGR